MNRIDHGLTLDSKVFNALKTAFNETLRRTLMNMEKYGSTDATINLKLEIEIAESYVKDTSRPQYEAEREITVPTFNHKITSAIPVKDEIKGKTGGFGFELIYDRDTRDYYMISTKDANQTSLFDEDPDELPDELAEARKAKEAAEDEADEDEETEDE